MSTRLFSKGLSLETRGRLETAKNEISVNWRSFWGVLTSSVGSVAGAPWRTFVSAHLNKRAGLTGMSRHRIHAIRTRETCPRTSAHVRCPVNARLCRSQRNKRINGPSIIPRWHFKATEDDCQNRVTRIKHSDQTKRLKHSNSILNCQPRLPGTDRNRNVHTTRLQNRADTKGFTRGYKNVTNMV